MQHKIRKFGLFFSIVGSQEKIELYKKIHSVLKKIGIQSYDTKILKEVEHNPKKLERSDGDVMGEIKKQMNTIDFAIADFSKKSRFVFFQTMLALEANIPVMCITNTKNKENFPGSILNYGHEKVSLYVVDSVADIEKQIQLFFERFDPRKKRFNIMLSIKTLQQLELLANFKKTNKAEVIRQLIEKEHTSMFSAEKK